jgi:hypothetical protein
MLDFDQSVGWTALEARLAATDSERHRVVIQTVIDHAKAEAVGDIDGLMKTLVAEPQYHFWGPRGDTGPKGYEGVRRYYEDYVKSGAAILSSVKERVAVDDRTICHEGTISTLASWKIARQRAYSIPRDDGHYLLRMRTVILWSFDDDGRAYGEDSYTAYGPDDYERVEVAELPPVYVDYLRSIGHPV